jgi:hypothetical protein
MAEIRKTRRNPALSEFRSYNPQGGTFFGMVAETAKAAYAMLEPVAIDKMKREGLEAGSAWGEQQFPVSAGSATSVSSMGAPNIEGAPENWEAIRGGIFKGESGGDYDALFGYANRAGGRFAGVRVTDMTVDEAIQFTNPSGEYAQWVKGQVGRVATPIGGYQIVGTTLRGAKAGLGLTGSEKMTPALQERLGQWIYRQQGTGAWEGYRGPVSGGGGDDSLAGGLTIIPGRPDTLEAPAAPAAAPPTLVRTSEGKLEPRLFSPASGPILQAYNAAFMAGAMAEAQTAGLSEMMNLSQQFPLDPEGFRQAAKGYVDERVKQLPVEMRAELRGVLEEEANRRFLGVMEDRHRDTQQRAANSTGALVDRWSKDYSDALAAGDAAASDRSLAQLRGVLSAREALPGLAWTPEQSENVIIAAQDQAEKIRETKRKEQENLFKKAWRLVSAAALNGQTAADEAALLSNPAAIAADPEAAQEAAAYVALRDGLPSFNAMPPDAQDQAVADLRAQPVDAESDLTVADAMAGAAANNRKAWSADPIQRAGEVLRNTDIGAPPEIGQIDPSNPQATIDAMAARREYGNRLAAEGYTQTPVYLSKTEADGFSKLLGPELPPEARLAIAASIVQGFGDDAPGLFAQLEIDPTLRHGASLMADGGSPAVAAEAMSGQAMLKEGLVTVPASLTQLNGVSTEIMSALSGLPAEVTDVLAPAQEFAKALYAARSAGLAEDDTEGQQAAMAQAWQDALGQQKVGNKLLGGVQTVAGQPVWLPPDRSGEDLTVALERLASGQARDPFMGGVDRDSPISPDWERFGQGLPMVGDRPLSDDYIRRGQVRLVPVGGSQYRMEIARAGTAVDVAKANGTLFIIDLDKL